MAPILSMIMRGKSRRERGQAILITLGLVLGLTIFIAATAMQVVVQLKSSRAERDYDRALQMAEAGANAYLNYLAQPPSNSPLVPWSAAHPVATDFSGTVPSLATIKANILSALGSANHINVGYNDDGTVGLVNYPAQASLSTHAPVGQQFGYYIVLTSTPSGTVSFISYGYANGILRRVRVNGSSSDVFDWAAVYGMDPYGSPGPNGPGIAANGDPSATNSGPAWNFGGASSIVGASGAEGVISNSNNVTWYDGPVIFAYNGNTDNPTDPTVGYSTPGVPTGHFGTGTHANPDVRRLTRSLAIETADEAAKRWAFTKWGDTTATSVDYFKTNHHDNATGIKYIVQATAGTHVGQYRELSGPNIAPPVTQSGVTTYTLNVNLPNVNTLRTQYGMVDGNPDKEIGIGVRIYPGNYYLTDFQQSQSNALFLRSFADGEGPGVDANGNTFNVYSSDWLTLNPNNPNASGALSGERNIRIWIGDVSPYNKSTGSNFSNNTTMENPTFASRFRVYDANRKGVSVSGTNTRQFRVNMLVKNSMPGTGANAGKTVFYGTTTMQSGAYLLGSLLSWQVTTIGSATIEKQAVEGSGGGGSTQGSDRLAYGVTAWTELP